MNYEKINFLVKMGQINPRNIAKLQAILSHVILQYYVEF